MTFQASATLYFSSAGILLKNKKKKHQCFLPGSLLPGPAALPLGQVLEVLGHLELAFWLRAGGRFCLLLASPASALWISKKD